MGVNIYIFVWALGTPLSFIGVLVLFEPSTVRVFIASIVVILILGILGIFAARYLCRSKITIDITKEGFRYHGRPNSVLASPAIDIHLQWKEVEAWQCVGDLFTNGRHFYFKPRIDVLARHRVFRFWGDNIAFYDLQYRLNPILHKIPHHYAALKNHNFKRYLPYLAMGMTCLILMPVFAYYLYEEKGMWAALLLSVFPFTLVLALLFSILNTMIKKIE